MAIMIKQLMPECTSCVARGPMWTMQQLSTLDPECGTGVNRRNGRENITRPNERNGRENITRPNERNGRENITRPNERNVEQE